MTKSVAVKAVLLREKSVLMNIKAGKYTEKVYLPVFVIMIINHPSKLFCIPKSQL